MSKKDVYAPEPPTAVRVSCDVNKRCVSLVGPITKITFLSIEQAIKRILKNNPKKPIRFIISSKGGDFYAGIRIFQYLNLLPVAIETIVRDRAFSAALIISQAGKIRSACKGARFGFHLANVRPENMRYNAKSFKDAAAILDRIDATQFVILTVRGRPTKHIFKLLDAEADVSAHEALKLNLIDRIISKSAIPKI